MEGYSMFAFLLVIVSLAVIGFMLTQLVYGFFLKIGFGLVGHEITFRTAFVAAIASTLVGGIIEGVVIAFCAVWALSSSMGPDGYNAIGELISAPFAFIGSTLAMAHVAKSTFFRTVVANCMAGVVALMVAAGVVVTTVLIIMANEPGGVANAIGNFP